ncbi:MAG: hypothetical protein RDV41_07925 [Planctomycetota bacterium]|nr:hypothetical protein [Planctomycetota bacterium]
MKCPFLEEVTMSYCRAYPIRKLVPSSSLHSGSLCDGGFGVCKAYQHFAGAGDSAARQGEAKAPQVEKTEAVPAPNCGGVCREASVGVAAPDPNKKYCVWLEQDIVSYRVCTKNYECSKCQFEQMLADRNGKYVESAEVVAEVERLRSAPTAQRRCKYMITGRVLYKPCENDYECYKCPTYLAIRDSVGHKVGV